MARVNQGKYKEYRNKYSEIKSDYKDVLKLYFNDEDVWDCNFDPFDFFNSADSIWGNSNKLSQTIDDMLHGDKFEDTKIKLEYENMSSKLNKYSADLVRRCKDLYENISEGLSSKEQGYLKEYKLFKQEIL